MPFALANPRPARSLPMQTVSYLSRNPVKYGIALAAVLGMLWWRRRKAKALSGADLGNFGASSMADLKGAVARQVALAKAHSPLADYRKAEDQHIFWSIQTPNVTVAHWKAAYWLAVAARCARAWQLADFAEKELNAGNAQNKYLKVNTTTGAAAAILTGAGETILTAAPANPGAKAAAAALGFHGRPEVIDKGKAIAKSQSADEIIKGTISGSADDAFSLVEYARGIVTGEQPRGVTDTEWFFRKWGLRAGIAVAGLITLRVLFAGEYHAGKAALSGAIARGKAAQTGSTGAVGE